VHKVLYIVRHCQATGQEPEASLTVGGRVQAEVLAQFLEDRKIERVVSSPFLRAIQSIEPLARSLSLEIETDERLSERVLSDTPLSNWLVCLRETFADIDLRFPGGESSRVATQRAVSVVQDILSCEQQITALISHGNLSTLLLNHFDKTIGISAWEQMTNPDVFCVSFSESKIIVEHIWKPVRS
jgi:2,3-bisphosphoglycerate-dependent phosphoglycerate mutase